MNCHFFITGYAFARANEELSNARKDSKKIIILLTDGETSKIDQPQLKFVDAYTSF